MTEWHAEVDLLVFGTGAGGLAAAVTGSVEGLDVLVCEKADVIGGTTANSGGAIWIPCSTAAAQAGKSDTPAAAREYLLGELGNFARTDLIDAFLETGPEALNYFAKNSELKFDPVQSTDYHSDRPGGSAPGRSLSPLPFDGRRLGKLFSIVRSPSRRFMLLGGMMVGRREIPQLLRPWQSTKAFRRVVELVARYAFDRLSYSRGTNLLIGNALVARGLASLQQRGVRVQTKAALRTLLADGDGTYGAEVEIDGVVRRLSARRGIVLATGGIPQGGSVLDAQSKNFPHHYTLAPEENTGDGVRAAIGIGGTIDEDLISPCLWTPASLIPERDGSKTPFPYGHLDRGKPGAIIVNARGLRFVNEAASYHDVVMAMFEAPEEHLPAFLLCDRAFIWKYGLGAIRPYLPSLEKYVRSGYVRKGDTIGELARAFGINEAQLEATVARHNAFAATGNDEDFGKGETAFNRSNGDPACKPNPNLTPIVKTPFFGMEIFPCSIGTSAGLKTDADARVLRSDGSVINGLYACGNDMASVMRGAYPGPGITLGPAIVFGYRAARHAAKQATAVARP